MHPLFECVRSAIEGDIGSMVEDGYDREELIRELESVAAKGSVDALLAFEQDLWSRPSRQPYDEPNDWESISRTFPDGQAHARFAGTKQDLLDRGGLSAGQAAGDGLARGNPPDAGGVRFLAPGRLHQADRRSGQDRPTASDRRLRQACCERAQPCTWPLPGRGR